MVNVLFAPREGFWSFLSLTVVKISVRYLVKPVDHKGGSETQYPRAIRAAVLSAPQRLH